MKLNEDQLELQYAHIKDRIKSYKGNISDNHTAGKWCKERQEGVRPFLSIMIPTFGRSTMLLKAIESALMQRNPLGKDYEVVVVDNNGKDSNFFTDILEHFPDQPKLSYYLNDRNLGMTGNWNKCIELAMGSYVTLLHDDDELRDDAVYELIQLLQKDTSALISPLSVSNEMRMQKKPVKAYIKKNNKISDAMLTRGMPSGAPGICFKRNVAISLGGYDDFFYPCADYVFYREICRMGGGTRLNKNLGFYRLEDNQTYKSDTLFQMALKSIMLKTAYAELSNAKLLYLLEKELLRWADDLDEKQKGLSEKIMRTIIKPHVKKSSIVVDIIDSALYNLRLC